MGKIVLIGLVIIIIILSVIVINVEKETVKVPEILNQDLAEISAKKLGNYALNYYIDLLDNDKISITGNTSILTFTDFNAFGGSIDSIRLSCNTEQDTFRVISYVNCNILDKSYSHSSESIIRKSLEYIPAAILAAGDIVVTGNAEITGEVIEQAIIDFEEIFGITKAAMRDSADYYYLDPPNNVQPVAGITWVDLSAGQSLRMTVPAWYGSGILIANGDCDITGGVFEGILYVVGSLYIRGNDFAGGMIFVECDADIITEIAGTAIISYDADIVEQYLENPPTRNVFKIIYWDEN